MIVKDFDLPADEEDSFEVRLTQAEVDADPGEHGFGRCIRCGRSPRSKRARRMCTTCWYHCNRNDTLEEYPWKRVDGGAVYREFIRLKRESDGKLSYQEIAGTIGLTVTQLKNAVRRRRQKLRIRPNKGTRYCEWE